MSSGCFRSIQPVGVRLPWLTLPQPSKPGRRIIIRRGIVQSWTLTLMDSAKAIILTEFGVSMEEWIQFQGDTQLVKRVRDVAAALIKC